MDAANVAGGRAPSKRDVELADTMGKWRFCTTLVWVIGAVFMIAASSLPILAAWGIVKALAGKETTLTIKAALALSVVINIPLGAITAYCRWKQKEQRIELERLRSREMVLEQKLEECQASRQGRESRAKR